MTHVSDARDATSGVRGNALIAGRVGFRILGHRVPELQYLGTGFKPSKNLGAI